MNIDRDQVLEILRKAEQWGNDADDMVTQAVRACAAKVQALPPGPVDPAIIAAFPGRQRSNTDEFLTKVEWAGLYGKFTSPPWAANTREGYAKRVTETSALAIREAQFLQETKAKVFPL